LPGVRLCWLRLGRDCELRDEAGNPLASLRHGAHFAVRPKATATAAGRTFTFRPARLKSKGKIRSVTELVDDSGLAAFSLTGENLDGRAQARVTFANRQVLRFLVREVSRETAIMTAVDQNGMRVARYRNTVTGLAQQAEIIVNPQWELTDERSLAIAISTPWLNRYFASEQL